MKPAQAAITIGIGESTLRKRANEYGEFLSEDSRPEEGKHRTYTQQDVRILALVEQMKTSGSTEDDISVTLRSLQSNNWERLPQLREDLQPQTSALTTTSPASVQLAQLETQITILQDDKQALEAKVRELELENSRVKGRDERLLEEIAELKQETRDLYKQIAKLLPSDE